MDYDGTTTIMNSPFDIFLFEIENFLKMIIFKKMGKYYLLYKKSAGRNEYFQLSL